MLGSYTTDYTWEGGREGEGVGAFLLVSTQQCCEKVEKKIDDNVFFFAAAGGLTDCIHTARCCFWGIAWLSIRFVVVVVVFLFLFSEMLPPPLLPPPSPYAVAARQIPTYLPT